MFTFISSPLFLERSLSWNWFVSSPMVLSFYYISMCINCIILVIEVFFSWHIVDLQCCVNYCCAAKWFSYTYIYTFFFFNILFHYSLSQDAEYRSWCFLPYIRGMTFCNLFFSKYSHVTAQRTRFSKQLLCRIPAYQHTWLLTPCPPEDMWAGSQSFCYECGTAGSGVSLGLNPNPAIDSYGLRRVLASFGPNFLICEMRAVLRSYDCVD